MPDAAKRCGVYKSHFVSSVSMQHGDGDAKQGLKSSQLYAMRGSAVLVPRPLYE